MTLSATQREKAQKAFDLTYQIISALAIIAEDTQDTEAASLVIDYARGALTAQRLLRQHWQLPI